MPTAPLDRKAVLASRPGVTPLVPSSPHTPQRGSSSPFSSPGSYRTEDEPVILEFAARQLLAGIAGHALPQCRIPFGPEQSRRVGDYRQWMPDNQRPSHRRQAEQDWTKAYELFPLDFRDADLELVADKIERSLRHAYHNYLLLDIKTRRIVLLVPALTPHPFLALVLRVLFRRFQIPSVTLLSPPTMAIVAAGLQSGLVIDIGWHETVMTAIYDYRELGEKRTTRAMRELTLAVYNMLVSHTGDSRPASVDSDKSNPEDREIDLNSASVEEVLLRLCWCRVDKTNADTKSAVDTNTKDEPGSTPDPLISIPAPDEPTSQPIQLPFSAFGQPVENVFFPKEEPLHASDDQEKPLSFLLYATLLLLPSDARAICMSRIVITGEGSRIPGLKTRLLMELSAIIRTRGWDPVWGVASTRYRARLAEMDLNRVSTSQRESPSDGPSRPDNANEEIDSNFASKQPQLEDEIAVKIAKAKAKEDPEGTTPVVQGEVRGIESLGSWAGASLVTSLRIRGLVEIERDAFLQHGLHGVRREPTAQAARLRQSLGAGVSRASLGGATTSRPGALGAWA